MSTKREETYFEVSEGKPGEFWGYNIFGEIVTLRPAESEHDAWLMLVNGEWELSEWSAAKNDPQYQKRALLAVHEGDTGSVQAVDPVKGAFRAGWMQRHMYAYCHEKDVDEILERDTSMFIDRLREELAATKGEGK